MHTSRPFRGSRPALAVLAAALALLAACGSGSGGAARSEDRKQPFVIGAIPDQDPEKLQRLYATVAGYLAGRLGVPVEYRPVTDYTASVSLFRAGDLDMVWFGGLTGVQARLQVPGARAIAQRDVDEAFHSVFVANTSTGIRPFSSPEGLQQFAGRRFTFGSESSTSGRLMPEYFLGQAGVGIDDFAGPPGFSGSHDKTIALVESGTFEAGVLNEQVWAARTGAGQVDERKVVAVYRTPPYHDYHWVIRPDVAERYGAAFVGEVTRALLDLDPADAEAKAILDLFGARRFIPTEDANYRQIEDVARRIGLVR
jgi:phosphonate transport system substrate-binding protein